MRGNSLKEALTDMLDKESDLQLEVNKFYQIGDKKCIMELKLYRSATARSEREKYVWVKGSEYGCGTEK